MDFYFGYGLGLCSRRQALGWEKSEMFKKRKKKKVTVLSAEATVVSAKKKLASF